MVTIFSEPTGCGGVRIRVKICGITTVEDALLAEAAGADAIGVVVRSISPRSVPPETAAAIFSAVGPFISTVAVTHTTSEKQLWEVAGLHPTALQISAHLPVPPSYTGTVIRVTGRGDSLPGDCDALVIDDSRGSGRAFDATFARSVVSASPVPVILAGGLSPGNVADAISKVRPYAVDVCSGVEREVGRKDPDLVRAFISAAKATEMP
jgi:phosphoribosylanthranilate isomerase